MKRFIIGLMFLGLTIGCGAGRNIEACEKAEESFNKALEDCTTKGEVFEKEDFFVKT